MNELAETYIHNGCEHNDTPIHPPRSAVGTNPLKKELEMSRVIATLGNARAVLGALTLGLASVAGIGTPATAFAVKHTGGEYNTLHAGLGAKGYDVVAYFKAGKPAIGSDRHTFSYGGVSWQFESRENRDLFAADPASYAPQYGGFCSWGVAQGKLFDIDPANGWTIHDGKLYLNFNADINRSFRGDTGGFVARANRNWPSLNR